MVNLASSERPDEMPHYVAFHQGLYPNRHHCVVSLSKTHLSLLSTGSTEEDLS